MTVELVSASLRINQSLADLGVLLLHAPKAILPQYFNSCSVQRGGPTSTVESSASGRALDGDEGDFKATNRQLSPSSDSDADNTPTPFHLLMIHPSGCSSAGTFLKLNWA